MKCHGCEHKMPGADGVLRCRVLNNAPECSEKLAAVCERFEPAKVDPSRVWYCDSMGRGD